MAWHIQALEIANEGKGTGKFRLTARSDEDGGGPYGLCDHEHLTAQDAYLCLEAQEQSQSYTGISFRKQKSDSQKIVELVRWINSSEYESLPGNQEIKRGILEILK